MGVDIIRGWISKVLPGYHERREMNYDFSQEIETKGIQQLHGNKIKGS